MLHQDNSCAGYKAHTFRILLLLTSLVSLLSTDVVVAQTVDSRGGAAEQPAYKTFLPLVSYVDRKWQTTEGPEFITAGPDGNMWFTENSRLIGKITPAGDVTEYRLPEWVGYTRDITAGPDGALWFTLDNRASLGRITIDGVFSEFPLPADFGMSAGLTVGPDGRLWFTSHSNWRIGRLNADGTVTQFKVPDASVLGAITTGPDGNLWFIESWSSRIGRLTPTGEVTHFRTPTWATGWYMDIASDSFGYLWYTVGGYDVVGRVSLDGEFTEYRHNDPFGITQAREGSMCVALASDDRIRCIAHNGSVVDLSLPDNSGPLYLATGPDGSLWITANSAHRIEVLPPPTSPARP